MSGAHWISVNDWFLRNVLIFEGIGVKIKLIDTIDCFSEDQNVIKVFLSKTLVNEFDLFDNWDMFMRILGIHAIISRNQGQVDS